MMCEHFTTRKIAYRVIKYLNPDLQTIILLIFCHFREQAMCDLPSSRTVYMKYLTIWRARWSMQENIYCAQCYS